VVCTIVTRGAQQRRGTRISSSPASDGNTYDHAHGTIDSADKGLSTRTSSRDPSGPLEVPLRLVLLNFKNGNPSPARRRFPLDKDRSGPDQLLATHSPRADQSSVIRTQTRH
jgi:hypothetical protein